MAAVIEPLVVLTALLVVLSGCGVQFHIRRLDDDSSRFNRVVMR
jgi:hypothetical protein